MRFSNFFTAKTLNLIPKHHVYNKPNYLLNVLVLWQPELLQSVAVDFSCVTDLDSTPKNLAP
jgi:hypothetical protein